MDLIVCIEVRKLLGTLASPEALRYRPSAYAAAHTVVGDSAMEARIGNMFYTTFVGQVAGLEGGAPQELYSC
jgi:hypothetical protein